MAFRRRSYKRRKPVKRYGKKKTYRRKYTKMVRYKYPVNKYSFTRYATPASISGSDVVPTYLGVYSFQFNSLVNNTEFSVLFDQFRINGVQLTFKLSHAPEAQTGGGANYPVMYYVTDHDDSTAPTNLSEILQYQTVKKRVLRANSWFSVYLKPAVLSQMYESIAATAYSPKFGQWIDFSDIATEHFGLKFVITGLYARYFCDVTFKYYFQCRKVR